MPGVGTQEAGKMVPDGDNGESEVGGTEKGSWKHKRGSNGGSKMGKKAKGPWKKAVNRGVILKRNAHQLVGSLTAISYVRPEAELFMLVKALVSSSSAPSQHRLHGHYALLPHSSAVLLGLGVSIESHRGD